MSRWPIILMLTVLTFSLVYGDDVPLEKLGSLGLKDAVGKRFSIGVGISDSIPSQTVNHDLLSKHFSMITPENCMKPQSVQKEFGEYDFSTADSFVDFAVRNQLKIVGHCLLWAKDDRTYDWYFKDGESPVSREVLLDRIGRDIRMMVGRYRGKIAMWDVVNEALSDSEGEYLRPSGFTKVCDDEFISEAFRSAHEADPTALLIYNDYNNEQPAKRAKMLRLIQSLQQKNIPLHAVGLQGHFEIDRIPFKDLEDTIIAVKALGLKVVVSELDIDMIPRGKWWSEDGKYRDELSKLDPYRTNCPPELLSRQAEQYAELFRLFDKYSDSILRVSFWNLYDGDSWLNDFPWKRTNHPLLFDRDRLPKPAYFAVVEALTK